MDQAWRIVKNEELKICCRLRLGSIDILGPLRDWAAQSERLEDDDPGAAPAPWELLRTLKSEAAGGTLPGSTVREVVPVLERVISSQGLEEGPIQEELRELDRFAE